MREDLELRQYAKANGFTEEFHVQDREHKRFEVPHFPIHFVKGDKHIWLVRKGWQTADLTGDGSADSVRYRNHQLWPTLKEALDAEK